MGLPLTCFSENRSKSLYGIIRANIDSFCPAEGSEGYGRASFNARGRKPLGGISRVEDITFDASSYLGEDPECPPQLGTRITVDSIASGSFEAITKELQRYDAAHKASDENKLFDPEGAYSPILLSPMLPLGRTVTVL